jgi:hypothetical protein
MGIIFYGVLSQPIGVGKKKRRIQSFSIMLYGENIGNFTKVTNQLSRWLK